MSKRQDGNGSSQDDGFADFSDRKPQVPTDITTPEEPYDPKAPPEEYTPPDPSDPHSRSRGEDGLEDFFNDKDLPVDMNAADVKRLMNEYLGRMQKGLRT